MCPAPLSCTLRSHTHLEWSTDQSKSGYHIRAPGGVDSVTFILLHNQRWGSISKLGNCIKLFTHGCFCWPNANMKRSIHMWLGVTVLQDNILCIIHVHFYLCICTKKLRDCTLTMYISTYVCTKQFDALCFEWVKRPFCPCTGNERERPMQGMSQESKHLITAVIKHFDSWLPCEALPTLKIHCHAQRETTVSIWKRTVHLYYL